MTEGPHHMRKPYDPTGYSTLRGPDSNRAEDGNGAQPVKPSSGELATETDRLRSLREALWHAFEAGPAAGLPNTLIDLTMAYTGSLRLQLNLRALANRGPQVKASPPAASRLSRTDKG